jgi:hypothetical protein
VTEVKLDKEEGRAALLKEGLRFGDSASMFLFIIKIHRVSPKPSSSCIWCSSRVIWNYDTHTLAVTCLFIAYK